MTKSPQQILENAYLTAQKKSLVSILKPLPNECIQDLKTIVENAESFKGVLGVTLTSIVYKIYNPTQDIRYHQDKLPNGYSGRTFDTRYITPFLQDKFPHLAMAESAWLTRSLEQAHPYDFNYPGQVQNKQLKQSFLNLLNRLQTDSSLASKLLVALLLMLTATAKDKPLFAPLNISTDLAIPQIVEAIQAHIYHRYRVSGGARLPVLAIYSVYQFLVEDVKRYTGKTLAPLETHTSPDARSRAMGDIEVLNDDKSCFEAVEIKHNRPITVSTIGMVYRKIQDRPVDRYYILTTNEPNLENPEAVYAKIAEIKHLHSCHILVNGVLPSLKYYLRMMSQPDKFIDVYTQCLEDEFRRSSGIKREHLEVWANIKSTLLSHNEV
jgi:DNA (cytosine-5)-methyltransferase 1